VREAADAELETLSGLQEVWRTEFRHDAVTCARALETAEACKPLAQAIAAFTDSKLDRSVAKKLGQRLRRYEGRIVGGLRFERDRGLTGGSARWRVVETGSPSGTSGTSGSVSADPNSVEGLGA
jgi:hypothetical protein